MKQGIVRLGLTALLVVSCEKKEDPLPPPAPAPAPPPAVSVAAEKPPEPEPEPPPAASAAPAPAPVPAASPKAAAAPKTAAAAPSSSATAPPKSGPLASCCASLSAEAKKGGPNANKYSSAAAICAGLDKQVAAGKANLTSAKVTLHAQLSGVAIPNGC